MTISIHNLQDSEDSDYKSYGISLCTLSNENSWYIIYVKEIESKTVIWLVKLMNNQSSFSIK